MRVRLNTLTRERRKADVTRRTHFKPLREQPAPPEPAAPAAESTSDGDEPLHRDQRERASGGPIDRAHYTCSCGYVFHADVSTSVMCPHCHATQAW
ncbi:MAG TPA: hypothetical protein VFB41_08640 [Solirubrobacteraceae bacterium]|nr:hypothetical protein [Solirubrobacteraceae bacterium]